jgi:hypothetical protein
MITSVFPLQAFGRSFKCHSKFGWVYVAWYVPPLDFNNYSTASTHDAAKMALIPESRGH